MEMDLCKHAPNKFEKWDVDMESIMLSLILCFYF